MEFGLRASVGVRGGALRPSGFFGFGQAASFSLGEVPIRRVRSFGGTSSSSWCSNGSERRDEAMPTSAVPLDLQDLTRSAAGAPSASTAPINKMPSIER